MGSFSVACGISNLPLGETYTINDDTVRDIGFVLIKPQNNVSSLYGKYAPVLGETIKVHADSKYNIYLPPIFGNYDSYGCIVNIEKTPTTDYIEKIYKHPVEKIIEYLCSPQRNVYEERSSLWKMYTDDSEQSYLQENGLVAGLSSLGFSVKINDEELQVLTYDKYSVVIDKMNGIDIFKDGNRYPLVSGLRDDNVAQFLNIFSYHTDVFPGFPEKNWFAVSQLSTMSGMFILKEVFDKMVPFISDHFLLSKRLEDFVEEWDEFINTFDGNYTPKEVSFINHSVLNENGKRRFASSWNLPAVEFLRRNTALPVSEYDHLEMFAQDYSFKNIILLKSIMSEVNRFIEPTLYSGEDAGMYLVELNKITEKILDDKEKYFL